MLQCVSHANLVTMCCTLSPYHPELQPIELIWGSVKNKIAQEPEDNIHRLHARVQAELACVLSATWVGAYCHVQQVERDYLADVPGEQLIARSELGFSRIPDEVV